MSVRTGGQIVAGTTTLVDVSPTLNSPRPVSSGGVYDTCANRSATNFTTSGFEFLSGISLPGKYYEELTVLASGSKYTAPANGWFVCSGILAQATPSAVNRIYLNIRETPSSSVAKTLNMIFGALGGYRHYVTAPAMKGNTLVLTNQSTQASPSWQLFFVYADGYPHESPVYTPIEYIEGITNTQYINARIIPDSTMKVYAKIGYTSGTSSLNLGARNDTYPGFLLSVNQPSSTFTLDWFGASVSDRWTDSITLTANDIYELTIENSVAELKQNGTTIGTHTYTPTGNTSRSVFLNALNNNGSPATVNNVGKVYAFKAWDSNNILLRDMIPVLDENNEPCMYDSVTDMLYYNAGTGSFTPGPILNS